MCNCALSELPNRQLTCPLACQVETSLPDAEAAGNSSDTPTIIVVAAVSVCLVAIISMLFLWLRHGRRVNLETKPMIDYFTTLDQEAASAFRSKFPRLIQDHRSFECDFMSHRISQDSLRSVGVARQSSEPRKAALALDAFAQPRNVILLQAESADTSINLLVEARVMHACRHPHIAEWLGFTQSPLYSILELAPLGDLHSLLKQLRPTSLDRPRDLTTDDMCHILTQLASGVLTCLIISLMLDSWQFLGKTVHSSSGVSSKVCLAIISVSLMAPAEIV